MFCFLEREPSPMITESTVFDPFNRSLDSGFVLQSLRDRNDVERVAAGVRKLSAVGIRVALFIAPDLVQIEAAKRAGAPVIELHTGTYAEATGSAQARELERLSTAAKRAANLGLEVHAGHGLTYNNVSPVAAIQEIVELNIGHCIIARAIFAGLESAVRDMKALMAGARR
jgi:pyridoxine 5-phosphate synthase